MLMDRPVRDLRTQGSQVVFFSNLPKEDEKKRELLTIARRFGVVEKHLFLTDQVSASRLCFLLLSWFRMIIVIKKKNICESEQSLSEFAVSLQAFIQLGSPQDAEMLVKYYTMNPLTIRGRPIRLNICAKYKTLKWVLWS